MSGRLVITLNDGSTVEHHISRPDLGGTLGDCHYTINDGVLFVHQHYEGTIAYPLTSVFRWELKR